MREQAADLLAEGDELYALLLDLAGSDWERATPFKGWTVDDVMWHLHMGDWLAVQSLTRPESFDRVIEARAAARARGEEGTEVPGLTPVRIGGPRLRERWRSFFVEMCEALGGADPRKRVRWVGPDMSVRMFATARQMETWAHGQDVYDLLRRPRTCHDRIRNIAELGCRTFRWTFTNRGELPPVPVPHVRLTAPSGAQWVWHEPSERDLVAGPAVDFCRVVTQGRNIADVSLTVVGESARRWMAIAQCFAGPPREPPAPGERVRGP